MKEQHMCVDVNSYIADLNCPVTVKEGNPVAALSFKNLHAGTMIAIKFAAKGYNSFGEIVPVNGEEQFIITVQDISVPQGGDGSEFTGTVAAGGYSENGTDGASIFFFRWHDRHV